jgi:hypothetical protein
MSVIVDIVLKSDSLSGRHTPSISIEILSTCVKRIVKVRCYFSTVQIVLDFEVLCTFKKHEKIGVIVLSGQTFKRQVDKRKNCQTNLYTKALFLCIQF